MENLKSILLLILFGLSLLLTYQLWYGEMPANLLEEDVYERLLVEEPRPLENVIMPRLIVSSVEGDTYVFKKGEKGYESLWQELSFSLQQISFHEAVEEDMPPAESKKVLTYYLQPELPVGEGLPWLANAIYAEIEMIELYTDNTNKWLVLSEAGNNHKTSLQLSSDNAERFNKLFDEELFENKTRHTRLTNEHIAMLSGYNLEVTGSIYVPQEPLYMDEIILNPEDLDHDLILKTFFVDYNMARIIEEKDGGLIYTDGEKGLRLTEGGLEYSSPRKETGSATVTYPEALLNSSSLLSYHGGWPEDLRLDELSLSGWGRTIHYNAEWCMYYAGFPILAKQPTKALFNDSGLIYYTRFIFTPDDVIMIGEGQKTAAMWYDALEKAATLFKDQASESENVLHLEEMKLGYVVTNSSGRYKGEPVWQIKISGETFTLQADQLNSVDEEDLQ